MLFPLGLVADIMIANGEILHLDASHNKRFGLEGSYSNERVEPSN